MCGEAENGSVTVSEFYVSDGSEVGSVYARDSVEASMASDVGDANSYVGEGYCS